MSREDYEVVIGLEVHAELSTKTKIFCSCPTEFGAAPNTHTCPICMAMPGTLPVLNEKVVEYAVKAGLATNCEIARDSKNDRKNYFYPDLPKSYQISQFDKPLCEHGYVDIDTKEGKKRIRITRIHIEEDAGKLNHDEFGGGSLVDLNRAGVPLIETVSEPDMSSAEEAEAYLRKLKSIFEYIEVSDCKMQEGSLRADVNVSVRKKGETKLGTRTEMKNMNSFRSIVRAIEYEVDRQIDVIEDGGIIEQETLRWDDVSGRTFSMRDKEDAQDYRYFPDPDLVAIKLSEEYIENIKNNLPELPESRKKRYMEEDRLSENILGRFNNIKLVDKYEAYEIFKKNYDLISGDLELIQDEGKDAIRQVDPNMIIKKKKGKDTEVQEGWKGHIIPFELAQSILLKEDESEIKNMKFHMQEIASTYESIISDLSEEDKEILGDALNEEKDGFVFKNIKNTIKSLQAYGESEYTTLIESLKNVEKMNNEEKSLKSNIKNSEEELHLKTKDVIENLTDSEIDYLLEQKWIKPIIQGVEVLSEDILSQLEKKLEELNKKYQDTFEDIENEIRNAEKKLAEMLDELTGTDTDMEGIAELKKFFGGDF